MKNSTSASSTPAAAVGPLAGVRKPQGRELFMRLLPRFDVLVENFRSGTMNRWGLDMETLHKANPRLTVLRPTGFGQTQPYAQRTGFARIFEAMSGFAHLTGEPDGRPALSGAWCNSALARPGSG